MKYEDRGYTVKFRLPYVKQYAVKRFSSETEAINYIKNNRKDWTSYKLLKIQHAIIDESEELLQELKNKPSKSFDDSSIKMAVECAEDIEFAYKRGMIEGLRKALETMLTQIGKEIESEQTKEKP